MLVIYEIDTGTILQTSRTIPIGGSSAALVPDGAAALETDRQDISGTTHRVNAAGKLIKKPPSRIDSEKKTKDWKRLRKHRSDLLRYNADTLNPMQWEEMTETKRQEWRDYRQSLLDLPQNTQNPNSPVWPEKPE